ncbi:hypothetical protein PR048_003397 [Dryococelus australis]|uniref:Uncharacterized protein n=1 Tax=Dryococelus australis TaxID=614101 RepID=A0ABQ9IN06_9NEOP|nr:hypothetical protein PR048_003397 [Dryococelus australis]
MYFCGKINNLVRFPLRVILISHQAFGATVAERLACSPLTKKNRVQSPAGPPDFCKWESCRTMPLVGGFLGVLPFPLPLHSSAAPYSLHSSSSALNTSLVVHGSITCGRCRELTLEFGGLTASCQASFHVLGLASLEDEGPTIDALTAADLQGYPGTPQCEATSAIEVCPVCDWLIHAVQKVQKCRNAMLLGRRPRCRDVRPRFVTLASIFVAAYLWPAVLPQVRGFSRVFEADHGQTSTAAGLLCFAAEPRAQAEPSRRTDRAQSGASCVSLPCLVVSPVTAYLRRLLN